MSRRIRNNFVISECKRGDSASSVDASLREESEEGRGETTDFDLGEMWRGVRFVENVLG